MARLIGITYAGITVGLNASQTSYELTKLYGFEHGWNSFSVDYEVIIANSTRATFLNHEASFISAMRTPDAACVIVLGATTRHTFDPSANTGFLTRATASKVEGSPNHAVYRVRITGQLPANLQSRDGRREASVVVEEAGSERKRLRFSGVYTALSSNGARAQFNAAVATWIGTVLTALGGTYEIESTVYDFDDQDKLLKFTRSYLERITNQEIGILDNSAIVDSQLTISRLTRATEAAIDAGVELPVECIARFSCWVKKSVTQDLVTLYAGTIRPHILSQAGGVAGGTAVIASDEPQYDFENNRIFSTVRVLGLGSKLIALRVNIQEDLDFGWAIYPVLGGDSAFDADVYKGPATHLIRIIRSGVGRLGSLNGNIGLPTLGSEFLLVGRRRPVRELYEQGLPGSGRLEWESVVDIFEYRKVGRAPEQENNIIPLTETIG